MAFVVGSIVSMSLEDREGASGLLGPIVQAQPPVFGIVGDISNLPTSVSVTWIQDGHVEAAIPVEALDLIGDPDAAEVTRLQGFFVRPSAAESPEYQGTVVMLYTRDSMGDGDPTDTLALMKTNVGLYRELLSASLVVVTGR